MSLTTRREYEEMTLSNRAGRMRWWKEARFGMFVHLGLYSLLGRHEWAMATECIPKEEYEQLAEKSPDSEAGVTVFKLEFATEPVFKWLPTTPAVVAGW